LAQDGDPESKTTGFEAAVLFDLLLELGVDVDEAMAWNHEERVHFVQDAIARGDIDHARAANLRELGVLPTR
jgi:hypothetical protein